MGITMRAASAPEGAAQLGQEPDPLGEHHPRRDRPLLGGRRRHDQGDTKATFEAYLEHVLAPILVPGRVAVMDNLSAHKGGRVRQIVEGRGCEPLYLPPYSPDFDPIEQAFSKVKALIRRAEGRTRAALIEAMGRALWARSRLGTRAGSSTAVVTAPRANCYDARFRVEELPSFAIKLVGTRCSHTFGQKEVGGRLV
jgi:transposase